VRVFGALSAARTPKDITLRRRSYRTPNLRHWATLTFSLNSDLLTEFDSSPVGIVQTMRAPKAVAGLILVDPVLPIVLARPDPMVAGLFASAAVPGLGRLISRRRLPPEAIVAAALALCCADPARVAPEVVARHVYVARQRMEIAGADRDFLSATRSVAARGRDPTVAMAPAARPVLRKLRRVVGLISTSAAQAGWRAG